MKVRSILVLLLLASLARAQERPKSPRQLFDAFFGAVNAYGRTGDDEALDRAGRMFDLSDLPSADADAIGRRAALDLKNFLDRVVEVRTHALPAEDFDPDRYAYTTPKGDILCLRGEDGVWRFSMETRDAISGFFRSVADRDPLSLATGVTNITDESTWLRDRMPEWLRNTSLLLEHWQWLGLLVLALLGVFAGTLVRGIVMFLHTRSASRRGVDGLGRDRKQGRPFSLVGMALLWFFTLHLLALPATAHTVLMLAIRVILMVGVVWSVCRVVDLVSEVFAGMAARTSTRVDDLLVPMVRRALKIFIVALGVVWIAENLDMDIAALVAGLGIGGVALALASKDTVENFFGALSILTDRPFQVGDWIVLQDIEGTVTEVGFRTTRVRTFYNSLITFPNSMLIRSAVDNLGAREFRRIKETIGVAYDTPPDKLEAFLEGIREIVRRHPYTRKDYFHVYFHRFGDSALEILLYIFVKTPDWATELRERQRLLTDVLRLAAELGVEFAFPTRTLHMVQDAAADHGERTDDIEAAHRSGRRAARTIVDQFTGREVPPPVEITGRPDDAVDEGE